MQTGKVVILSEASGVYFDPVKKETIDIHVEDGTCFTANAQPIMFFCRKNLFIPKPEQYTLAVSNNTTLLINESVYYQLTPFFSENPAISFGMDEKLTFKKVQDFYNYILLKPNTKFIDFDHKIFEKPQPEPLNTLPQTPIKENQKWKEWLEMMKKKKPKQTGSIGGIGNALGAISNLNYEFRNFTYTENAGKKYLEFDIYISDDVNPSYFDAGLCRISFNTTVFGSSIATTKRIKVTRGKIIASSTDYMDPEQYMQDASTSDVAIPISTPPAAAMNPPPLLRCGLLGIHEVADNGAA